MITQPSLHRIVRTEPAERWLEALPLGNGRTGVMVFGGEDVERLALNDSTAWSGGPAAADRPPLIDPDEAAAALAEARQAIAEGRHADATPPLQRLQHRHTQAFLPLGHLTLTATGHDGDPTHYERSLDLATATHETTSTRGGWTLTRRTWVSHPAQVGVVEVSTDRPGGLRLEVAHEAPWPVLDTQPATAARAVVMQLPSDVAPPHDASAEPFGFDDDPLQAGRAAVVVSWQHDGRDAHDADSLLAADGVTTATVWFTTATTFAGLGRDAVVGPDEMLATAYRTLARAAAEPVAELHAEHVGDHSASYARNGLEAGEPRDGAESGSEIRPGQATPELLSLLYNFGRYLLLSASRAGSPPANLQGIWNDEPRPPWSSNYTTNINLPMNYWGSDVANLPETIPPLLDLVDALVKPGTSTAADLYGSPGWVAHHNTDIWAYTRPVGHGQHDPSWAFWPFGGAWLLQAYRHHLDFGAAISTPEDLARRAWEPTLGAAEFVLHWLRDQADGTLGTSPSTSPENVFFDRQGRPSAAGRSSSMDLTLSRDTLRFLLELADVLGHHGHPVVRAAAQALPRIPEPAIGRDGTIREWADDPVAVDPLHRHQSHLYFAYPGTDELTPERAAAVARSLDLRGDDSTGWSLAWRLALRARLHDSDAVSRLLRLVTRSADDGDGAHRGGLYANLFAAHPPFQIDGNYGYVSGLAECLIQSHRGRIELLPALPEQLPDGRAWGLVARPGIVVDLEWKDQRLTHFALRPRDGRPTRVTVSHGGEDRTHDVVAPGISTHW